MARFASMVNTGEIPGNYRNKAAQYLSVVQNQLVPKWNPYYKDLSQDEAVYVFPDDGSGWPNSSLPHNQYLAMAEALIYLYKATDNATYKIKAQKLLLSFKNDLRKISIDNEMLYEWNYWDAQFNGDRIIVARIAANQFG